MSGHRAWLSLGFCTSATLAAVQAQPDQPPPPPAAPPAADGSGGAAHAAPSLVADYFDGHSAQPRPVRLSVHGRMLHIDPLAPTGVAPAPGAPAAGSSPAPTHRPDAPALRVPVRRVSWPERQRHGQRQAYLPGHGLLTHADAAAWDAWARASGVARSVLVAWMQSWRGALLALVALLALLWGSWHWGVPLAARGMVALVPPTVDARLGEMGLAELDQSFLRPSTLPAAEQQRVLALWQAAVRRWQATPGTPPVPAWTLQFRHMPGRPGDPRPGQAPPFDDPGQANALALPGGTLIVSDGMVRLLQDRPDVLIGVLGHELGHVQHRHGMRALVQAGLLGLGAALLLGDVSQLLAAVPVMLGQAAYSRAAEFEADAAAAAMLCANGHPPRVMALLFDRLATLKRTTDADEPPGWQLGLASHPPDAQRIRALPERCPHLR